MTWKLLATRVFLAAVLGFLCFLNLLKKIWSPVYRLVFGVRIPLVIRTPEDRFKKLKDYPFHPHYIELEGGCGIKLPRVHYLDEGPRSGRVILCLHGEPTWSYLYRKMIPFFVAAGYRVIVPDFIGFGKSDKYTSPRNYTHELHTFTLRILIEKLALNDICLVCQDWGGLTGLSVVKDCPELFSHLVVMNTGLPDAQFPVGQGVVSRLFQLMPFMVWRNFTDLVGTHLPLHYVYKFAMKSSAKEEIEGYVAPHPTWLYKGGVAAWPLLVPLYQDDPVTPHMWEARNELKLWRKPMLVMFSDSDPVTRGQEKVFLKLVPGAQNIKIKGAGHFLQETHSADLSKNIIQFLETNPQSTKM